MNTVHAVPSYFFKIFLNIIIPYISRSCKLSLSFIVSFQKSARMYEYLLPIRTAVPAHLILLDMATQQHLVRIKRSCSFSLCNLLHPLFRSSVRLSFFLSSPLSNVTSSCYFCNERDPFHNHVRQREKITFLYVLIS